MVKKSDDEIFEALGSKVSSLALLAADDVKLFAFKEVSVDQRHLLPPTPTKQSDVSLGKKTFNALRRVAWKILCDKNKGTYHIWTNGLAAVFGGTEFLRSVASAFESWNIGDLELISAFTASAVKTGCEVFCSELKPESLIIHASE